MEDVGCYHSLARADERKRYTQSLLHVLAAGGVYLAWCFLRQHPWRWGPPGVEEDELEQGVGRHLEILDRRKVGGGPRDLVYYAMAKKG